MSHWVFHPEQEAKIVTTEEYAVHLLNGWFDSPAKFQKNEEENIETQLINESEDVPCGTSEPKRRGRPPRIV